MTKQKKTTPNDLIKALKASGYTPVKHFGRQGNRLTVRLKPAQLKGEDGNFRALETCTELGLQASCRVLAAVPQDILMVAIELGDHASAVTPHVSEAHASTVTPHQVTPQPEDSANDE